MASRTTEYRRRKGLTQVEIRRNAETWALAFELTGAPTKRAVVEELLRRAVAAKKLEEQSAASRHQASAGSIE